MASPKIFIAVALPCEAKPLIEYYRLKKDTTVSNFAIYRNNTLCLTVTGIGKTAMAAGVAYCMALCRPEPNPVMVNVGIAGHQTEALGSLFLAGKITDMDTGRRFYPPLLITPPCPTANLLTFSRPQTSYPDAALCDMEAASFFETAVRFTTGELCHCIKIVSDNAHSPAEQLDAGKVTALIQSNIEDIGQIIENLGTLAASISTHNHTDSFEALTNRYRFSVNEQLQLKKLLARWQLTNEQSDLDLCAMPAKNGKEFLAVLNQQLDEARFHL